MRLEIASRRSWKFLAAATVAGAMALAVPPVACAQQVFAFVNGQQITVLDIEHRNR